MLLPQHLQNKTVSHLSFISTNIPFKIPSNVHYFANKKPAYGLLNLYAKILVKPRVYENYGETERRGNLHYIIRISLTFANMSYLALKTFFFASQ